VETAQQRNLLASVECDYVQGYLYARPMSATDFEHFMAVYTPAPAAERSRSGL
jgi:EAL domain-containing protein (putative c-di-GMP-specific phosphodiesterase class I)